MKSGHAHTQTLFNRAFGGYSPSTLKTLVSLPFASIFFCFIPPVVFLNSPVPAVNNIFLIQLLKFCALNMYTDQPPPPHRHARHITSLILIVIRQWSSNLPHGFEAPQRESEDGPVAGKTDELF